MIMTFSEKECPLDKEQVTKAVKALKSYIDKVQNDSQTLLDDHNRIQIQVTMHRIPSIRNKSIFLELSHPIYDKESEICLITKDFDKNDPEKSETHYQDLLAEKKIENVSKILPIQQLKLDYRSYESRRRLVDMYGLFLCDRAISYRMSSLMGKVFHVKRKDPWSVNMDASNLKKELEMVTSKTKWFLSGDGASSLVVVAKTTFPISNIVENIMACAAAIAKRAPRGWNNIRALHIKTNNSVSLPVYINDDAVDVDDLDPREVESILSKRKKREDVVNMWNLAGVKKRKKIPGVIIRSKRSRKTSA